MLSGADVSSDELGYVLEGWHTGIIASGRQAQKVVQLLATRLGRELLQCRSWTRNGMGLAAAGGSGNSLPGIQQQAATLSGLDVLIAIGEPCHGVDGWRLTHRQAQAALRVAGHAASRVTLYADDPLASAALQDETLMTSLLQIYLQPLEAERDGGVASRETLRAFFASGRNAAAAAHSLGVNRHTVERRLHKAEELLGRSVRGYSAEIEVALRLDALGGHAGRSLPA